MYEMSQSELTQVDFATQIDTYYSQIGDEDHVSQEIGPEAWLRIVSLHPSIAVTELFPKVPTEPSSNSTEHANTSLYARVIETSPRRGDRTKEEHLHEHILGRSKKSADIQFESAKVSNIHCKIFLKRVYTSRNEYRLEPFIMDVSANGTYVDRTTKIKKNEPRKLRSGDVISLIDFGLLNNNRLGSVEKRALKEEIEKQSFIVLIPSGPAAKEDSPVRYVVPPPSSVLLQDDLDDPQDTPGGTGAGGGAIHRESTVFRMVQQQRRIGDYYALVKHIGSGGCGLVFEGVHKYTGVAYAIKKMDLRQFILANNMHKNMKAGGGADQKAQAVALREQATRDLLKEAELLRAIRHEHIINFEDAFADDSYLYLVLELVTGGDLFDRLQRKGVYSEQDAKHVITALLQAIALLHSKNIAHRDLKPENILLTSQHSDVDIKLTDFGLAKQIQENTRLKTYCGTPQYFAPEVYKAQAQQAQGFADSYTLAADMWSLGVLLFVLLSSTYPFPDLAPTQVPVDMLKGNFSFNGQVWQGVSTNCKQFIRALLQPDAQLRLAAVGALQHIWITVNPAPILVNTASVSHPPAAQPSHEQMSLANENLSASLGGSQMQMAHSQSPDGVAVVSSHNNSHTLSSMEECSLDNATRGGHAAQWVPFADTSMDEIGGSASVGDEPVQSVTAALIDNINANMVLEVRGGAGSVQSPRIGGRKRKVTEQSPPRTDLTASNTASNANCSAGTALEASSGVSVSASASPSAQTVETPGKSKRQKQVKIMEMFAPSPRAAISAGISSSSSRGSNSSTDAEDAAAGEPDGVATTRSVRSRTGSASCSASASAPLTRRTSTRQKSGVAANTPEPPLSSLFASPSTKHSKSTPTKVAKKISPAKARASVKTTTKVGKSTPAAAGRRAKKGK